MTERNADTTDMDSRFLMLGCIALLSVGALGGCGADKVTTKTVKSKSVPPKAASECAQVREKVGENPVEVAVVLQPGSSPSATENLSNRIANLEGVSSTSFMADAPKGVKGWDRRPIVSVLMKDGGDAHSVVEFAMGNPKVEDATIIMKDGVVFSEESGHCSISVPLQPANAIKGTEIEYSAKYERLKTAAGAFKDG